MEKILIFTNERQVKDVNDEYEKIINIHEVKESFIGKVQSKCVVHTTSISDGEIFLISDELKQEEYNKFICEKEDDDIIYIIRHDKPMINFNEPIERIEIGHHVGEDKVYGPILNILADNEGNKTRRVINDIFIKPNNLDIVLEFLHKCLVTPPKELGLLSQLPESDKIETSFKALQRSFTKSKENPFSEEYLIALAEFRDTVFCSTTLS